MIYYELDTTQGGILVDQGQKIFDQPILAIDIGQIPEGRLRFKFLIAAFLDCTVRVLSLEPETRLGRVSRQMVQSQATAVSVIELDDQLHLHVGLENGVLLRSLLDNITGNLSDSRAKFLGLDRISLSKVQVQGQQAVLALSSQPYLCYSYMNAYQITPLSYAALEQATSFNSTQCSEGIVGIKDHEVRIVTVERLGEVFTQKIMRTRYTPIKMLVTPYTNNLFVVEKDFNCSTHSQRDLIRQRLYANSHIEEYEDLDFGVVGYPKPSSLVEGKDQYASCIRIVDPFSLETVYLKEFENDQAVFSAFFSTSIG